MWLSVRAVLYLSSIGAVISMLAFCAGDQGSGSSTRINSECNEGSMAVWIMSKIEVLSQ